MHSGKKRDEVKTAEQIEKEKVLIERITKVMSGFLKVRNNWKQQLEKKSIDELLKYSQSVLVLMNETPTVYNFREDLLLYKFDMIFKENKEKTHKEVEEFILQQKEPENENTEPIDKEMNIKDITKKNVIETLQKFGEIIKSELEFQVQLIMKDQKSYQLWYHRQWLLKNTHKIEYSNFKTKDVTKKALKGELMICQKFLNKDERNFHAWNYRSYIVGFYIECFPDEKIDLQKSELEYLDEKLNKNFSNFSALHFRSKYQIQLASYQQNKSELDAVDPGMELFDKEYHTIETGLCMVPYEQSLWIYQRWINQIYKLQTIQNLSCKNSTLSVIMGYNLSTFESYKQKISTEDDTEIANLDFKQIEEEPNQIYADLNEISCAQKIFLKENPGSNLVFEIERKNPQENPRVISKTISFKTTINCENDTFLDKLKDLNWDLFKIFTDKDFVSKSGERANTVLENQDRHIKQIYAVYDTELADNKTDLNKDAVQNECYQSEIKIKFGDISEDFSLKLKNLIEKLKKVDKTDTEANLVDYHIQAVIKNFERMLADYEHV